MLTNEANWTTARAASYRVTKDYSISDPADIVLEDIAMARGVLVMETNLKGADARLFQKGSQGVIRVKANLSKGQKRFAIAHEIGHWEIHKGISQIAYCSDSQIAGYKASAEELEASCFASELLMPTGLFRPLSQEADPSLELIKQLADKFNTGLTATALRFVELNENPCMIVLSDGKNMRWWRKNNGSGPYWLESRQKIDSTLANKCMVQISDVALTGQVPISAWFPRIEQEDRDTVFEQSMRLGSFNTVLTLLWFD
jgi:Zn-dependent peptidase ImmA (M78 family)